MLERMPRTSMLLLAAALAACGSKSTPKPTTPTDSTPVTSAPATPTAPATPPAEPAEPAPAPPDPKVELLAAETAAWETAKPVFTKFCASCHTKDGKQAAKKKLDHFAMDGYPLGGHHAAMIGLAIRDVLGISGKKATMPYGKAGAVKGDDLAAIKAWTDAWEAADKAGAHAK